MLVSAQEVLPQVQPGRLGQPAGLRGEVVGGRAAGRDDSRAAALISVLASTRLRKRAPVAKSA